ncbi:Major Facilitator Superfamily [uncultured Clostridium sp.]|nr:Major Facilitator Superfamily [uncultured Clostridium sp.]
MREYLRKMDPNVKLFFIISALIGLGMGLSDSVYSNYFKDVYDVTALQRGLIETPRELPGMLLLVMTSLAGFLGDLRLAIIAQLLCAAGVLVLGLWTPPFGLMLVFLFINSTGMHLYMPLQESIAVSLIKDGKTGSWLGKFTGFRTAFVMVAGLLVFFGFGSGFLSFNNPIVIFIIAAACSAVAALLFIKMRRNAGEVYEKGRPKFRFVFKKRYAIYYVLAIVNGAHKQIMTVFGPWVLIELMLQQTDTMAILSVIGSGIGVLFIPLLGRLVDQFGVKKVMFGEGLVFIFVYLGYAFVQQAFSPEVALWCCFAFYVLNRMGMQFAVARTVYLRNIAETPEDIMPTLSTGISLDHLVSIAASALGGWIWYEWGYQYVFFIAAGLSLINMAAALIIKEDKPKAQA